MTKNLVLTIGFLTFPELTAPIQHLPHASHGSACHNKRFSGVCPQPQYSPYPFQTATQKFCLN
jgi:hypothetical protein